VEVDPSDYPKHKGIPDARMKELMDEFIRFLQQQPDQAAYIELRGAEWNEEWRRKWEEYCQLKGSCFDLVWKEGVVDKDKEAPRLRIRLEVLKEAAVEETMAFFIVLEAVLVAPREVRAVCLKDLLRAIQKFLGEMYLIHNGWGFYYFKHAGCVMLEADNHRLKAVLASAEPADGVEVKGLDDCGSVTFFHIALQAHGMWTGSLRATPVSSDVLREEVWP